MASVDGSTKPFFIIWVLQLIPTCCPCLVTQPVRYILGLGFRTGIGSRKNKGHSSSIGDKTLIKKACFSMSGGQGGFHSQQDRAHRIFELGERLMSGYGEPQGLLSFPVFLGHAPSNLRFPRLPMRYPPKARDPPLWGCEAESSDLIMSLEIMEYEGQREASKAPT